MYDESMSIISSIPYDMKDVDKIDIIGAPSPNGLIKIKDSKRNLWGYMNFDGAMIIDYLYKNADSFSSDNVAIVRTEKGLEGAIDEKENYVIEPMYYNISHLDDGRAFAKVKENAGAKLIDIDGQTIAEGSFSMPIYGAFEHIFNDGLACVQDYETTKYGYVDLNGNYIIEPQFSSADDFTDGLARVVDDALGLQGYISTDGEYVIEPKYKELGQFVDGYAYAINKDGLAGAIDMKGNEVISCQYENVTNPYDGIFGIKENGLFGYYSLDKGWIIEPKYTSASSFKNGYAIVR